MPEELPLEKVHACFNEAYKFYKEKMDKPIDMDFWKTITAEIKEASETKPHLQFELYMAIYDYFKIKSGEKK